MNEDWNAISWSPHLLIFPGSQNSDLRINYTLKTRPLGLLLPNPPALLDILGGLLSSHNDTPELSLVLYPRLRSWVKTLCYAKYNDKKCNTWYLPLKWVNQNKITTNESQCKMIYSCMTKFLRQEGNQDGTNLGNQSMWRKLGILKCV